MAFIDFFASGSALFKARDFKFWHQIDEIPVLQKSLLWFKRQKRVEKIVLQQFHMAHLIGLCKTYLVSKFEVSSFKNGRARSKRLNKGRMRKIGKIIKNNPIDRVVLELWTNLVFILCSYHNSSLDGDAICKVFPLSRPRWVWGDGRTKSAWRRVI